MALWLEELGANVTGYALRANTKPNHWELLAPAMADIEGDTRDYDKLLASLLEASPEIVFHFAAQSLVRESYHDPLETWTTNVIGTANLLEACRQVKTIKAIVVVTTDKVYENKEWSRGYHETDRLGGHDPYSASKAATELVVNSFRKSFFNSPDSASLASARAGNVIGGGDWSADRLIPDLARAFSSGTNLIIRSPESSRPWQHVLDCLRGYLILGERLLNSDKAAETSWNFGPPQKDNLKVSEVLNLMQPHWPGMEWTIEESVNYEQHEAGLLYLDSGRANSLLGWQPVWDLKTALRNTSDWYRHFYESKSIDSLAQLNQYIADASAIKEPG